MPLDDFIALSLTHQREQELEHALETRRRQAEAAVAAEGSRLAVISRLAREARGGRPTLRHA